MITSQRNRKLSIFLSTTSQGGMADIRRKLASYTIDCGHIPVSMDLWASSSRPVREVIHNWLENCDVFVQVIGADYGSRPDAGKLSYTEIEFQEARDLEKPILSFILDDGEFAAAKNKASKKSKADFDSLTAFRQQAKDATKRHVRPFSLKQQGSLFADYIIAIQEHANSVHEGGWVREPDVRDAIQLNDTIRGNDFFARFVDRLKTFPILSERTSTGKEEKQTIAHFFWNQYLSRLAAWRFNRVFIESGSTPAYVGYEFRKLIQKRWMREYIDSTRDKESSEFRIYTNNILTYLDFVMAEVDSDPTRIFRFPVGPADPYYGATFGDITSLVDVSPSRERLVLSAEAKQIVDKYARTLIKELNDNGIILMTASGLDTSSDRERSGPHVGSYYNMLIKRALIKTRMPTALFLHSTKIDEGDFKVGKCFAVCDQTWRNVIAKQPFAVVTSAESPDMAEQIAQKLTRSGFQHLESNWSKLDTDKTTADDEPQPPPQIIAIIASNRQFRELFLDVSAKQGRQQRPPRK